MSQKTYYVETLGCQMNVHDSERIAGVLEEMGYVETTEELALKGQVDVFAINTCAVRENAATKLYGHLGNLAREKRQNPNMQIAVGGCLAQKDREEMVKRAPWVDAVFGTHNLQGLPNLLRKAAEEQKAQVECLPRLVEFPSNLASARQTPHSAWVSISMGCNNTCTFCIVPSLRGRERDRRAGEILDEVASVVRHGAHEVTLLGQNVNSYGAEFGDRGAFGKLLRAMGEYEHLGLARVRYTSPHPASFTDDVIAAHAETPNVMPSMHMPLQSGSDRVLRQMRRSYNSGHFLKTLGKIRAAIPDIAITTDIIVGFPGETEEDFQQTLDVVREANFSQAYTFQYSIRPGTPAATMDNQIPKEIVQERFERLLELQNQITWDQQLALVGQELEVMVDAYHGRKDELRTMENGGNRMLTGHTRDARLVHFTMASDAPIEAGDLVQVRITKAAPFHLLGETL